MSAEAAGASQAAAPGLHSRERTAGVPVVPLRGRGQVGFGSFPRARVAAIPQLPPPPGFLEAALRAGSGGRLAPGCWSSGGWKEASSGEDESFIRAKPT